MKETRIIRGIIEQCDYGEESDGIWVGDNKLSRELSDLEDKQVSVRFYLSDVELTDEKIKEQLLLSISGSLTAEYRAAYSDYTGYLWSNDELEIGGHKLLEDLRQHIGKYCLLEIDIHI